MLNISYSADSKYDSHSNDLESVQVHGFETTCSSGPNAGQSLRRHFGFSKWSLGHSGCHQRWLPWLIKRGGDDTDWRVIPLHITSFIKGLPWPSKGAGQWSSIPPATHPETPKPLNPCVQPPAPLCSLRGKITLSQGNTAPLRWREGCTKEGEV